MLFNIIQFCLHSYLKFFILHFVFHKTKNHMINVEKLIIQIIVINNVNSSKYISSVNYSISYMKRKTKKKRLYNIS